MTHAVNHHIIITHCTKLVQKYQVTQSFKQVHHFLKFYYPFHEYSIFFKILDLKLNFLKKILTIFSIFFLPIYPPLRSNFLELFFTTSFPLGDFLTISEIKFSSGGRRLIRSCPQNLLYFSVSKKLKVEIFYCN